MAKTKKVNDGIAMPERQMYVDFDDLEEVSGLKVGDTVRILVKGKVKSVEQRESWDDPKVILASICVRDFEAEVTSNINEFEALAADEDD